MSNKKRDKENILLKVSTTRKYYLPFYLLIILLAGFMIYLDIKGITLSWVSIVGFLVFFFLVLNFTEVHRMSSVFKITPHHISCTYGILNKNIKRIDYFAISDIYKKQNFWQWLFFYGDVNISLYSSEATTRIRNINRPSRFVEIVENAIKRARNKKD